MALPKYIDATEARAIAAELPAVAAFDDAADADIDLAAAAATADVDAALRYQGRKYDAAQELEFPRAVDGETVHYSTGSRCLVWDWDSEADEAIVPAKVKLAVLYQIQAILSGSLRTRREAVERQIVSKSTGSLSETYAVPTSALTGQTRAEDVLTPMALVILRRYQLRSGRIL